VVSVKEVMTYADMDRNIGRCETVFDPARSQRKYLADQAKRDADATEMARLQNGSGAGAIGTKIVEKAAGGFGNFAGGITRSVTGALGLNAGRPTLKAEAEHEQDMPLVTGNGRPNGHATPQAAAPSVKFHDAPPTSWNEDGSAASDLAPASLLPATPPTSARRHAEAVKEGLVGRLAAQGGCGWCPEPVPPEPGPEPQVNEL